MELTAKGRYAVMAMADLAKFGRESRSVPLSAIAQRQQISLAYLEQIFAQLRRAGLVTSMRGRSGGYLLGCPANEISIARVMSAVEEGMRMIRCEGTENGTGCVGDERCITHELWTALGSKISHFLSQVTLQDLLDGKSAGQIGHAMTSLGMTDGPATEPGAFPGTAADAATEAVTDAVADATAETRLKSQIANYISKEPNAE